MKANMAKISDVGHEKYKELKAKLPEIEFTVTN